MLGSHRLDVKRKSGLEMASVFVEEPSHSQADLDGVHSRVQIGEACVGDVHIAHLDAPVVFCVEDVRAEGGLVHEVDRVGVGGNFVVGENDAAGEFEIWREAAVALKIPFEAERIETSAVGGVEGLEDHEHGNGVDRIFETSTKNAGKVEIGDDPSVANARIECAGVFGPTGDGMASARPDFDFVAALFGAGLGDGERCCQ